MLSVKKSGGNMRYSNRWAAMAALAALATGNAAQAADVVYLGECERARAVQKQSTIDVLLPYKRFEGVMRMPNLRGINNCTVDQLQSYTLTERSRNRTEIVFDVFSTAVNVPQITDCVAVEVRPAVVGTVRFSTAFKPLGDLCEVYIWSEWKLTKPSDPNWKDNFSNRAVGLTGGHFIISQLHANGSQQNTPIAFTGFAK